MGRKISRGGRKKWSSLDDNAVFAFVHRLPRHAVLRFLRKEGIDDQGHSTAELRKVLAALFLLDLPGFLNRALRAELEILLRSRKLSTKGSAAELRMLLWREGAKLEAKTDRLIGTSLQPLPIILRGKLVHLGHQTGIAADAQSYPRPIPPPRAIEAVVEPDCLEQLLSNADALIGFRLGAGTRDKGAFGARIAAMLGVPERGYSEPDWQGEVEIKTIPVVRDRAGWWCVKEDPAVSMETASPMAKLRRVLWITRAADEIDSPILSWYYQELGPRLTAMVKRFLHTRPKGPKGATTRGWYVHKRYFLESGLLETLNGK